MRYLASQHQGQLNIETSSAGLEAHGLNPNAIAAMHGQGIDISNHTSDVLDVEMIDDADLIVTVCSHADANCPLVPATKRKLHIPFTDPAKAVGTDDEITQCFFEVCLQIRESMSALIVKLEAEAG